MSLLSWSFLPLLLPVLAQTSPADPLPSWISTLISLGGFGLSFFMLSTDRWITNNRHEQVVNVLTEERDYWKQASEIARDDKEERQERDRAAAERERATLHLFEELKRMAEENRRS